MLFAIDNGKPYLISQGMAYPVAIDHDSVKLGEGKKTTLVGIYSLMEIHAKLGLVVSSIETKSTKAKSVKKES